jgi:hypothetical protein
MDNPEPLAIFLDTNVMLHFRRIDEVDWCKLAGIGTCDLVATPLLFRELDAQKALNPSSKLRRRAGEAIDYLANLLDRPAPIEIRDNVCLAIMDHEPLIDFTAHRLTRELGDDQLIASALDYSNRTGRAVGIATGDRGLALKIRSRPVTLVRMPDKLRLPPAAEADATKMRQLKREIAELKLRQPKLALSFGNGTTRVLMTRPRMPEEIATLEQVKAGYRPLSLPTTVAYDRYAELLAPGDSPSAYSRYVAEQYNGELERFFESYAEYVSAYEAWRESVSRTFELDFLLHNRGRGPATNIDVHITFPEALGLFDVDSVPQRPTAPDPPDPTGNRIFGAPSFRMGPVFAIGPKPHREGLPGFERGGHHLAYDAGALKHTCQLRCESVAIRARSDDDLRPFQLRVSIICNETERIEDSLSVGFN